MLHEDMILKLRIKLISLLSPFRDWGKLKLFLYFTIGFCLISSPQTETHSNFQIPTQTLQLVVVSRQNRNFH